MRTVCYLWLWGWRWPGPSVPARMARLRHTCTLRHYHRKLPVSTACRPERAPPIPGETHTYTHNFNLTHGIHFLSILSVRQFKNLAHHMPVNRKMTFFAHCSVVRRSDSSQLLMMNLSLTILLNLFSQESASERTNEFTREKAVLCELFFILFCFTTRRHNNRYFGHDGRPTTRETLTDSKGWMYTDYTGSQLITCCVLPSA